MTNVHIWTVSLQSTPSLVGNVQDLIMAGKPFQFSNQPIVLTRREATVKGQWSNYYAQYVGYEFISWFTITGRVVR